MRLLISVVGILLILVGITVIAYQGFTFTKHEQVAQIGNLNITTDTQKTVHIPPALGGLSLAAGIVLVVVSRLGGRSLRK